MSKFTKPTILRTSRTDPPCTYHPGGGGRDVFCMNTTRVPDYCSDREAGNVSSRPAGRREYKQYSGPSTVPPSNYRPLGGGRDMFIMGSPPTSYSDREGDRGLSPREKDVCYRSPARASTANTGRYISPEAKQARKRSQQARMRNLSTPLSFRNKWVGKEVLGKKTMFSDPRTLRLASGGIPISAGCC